MTETARDPWTYVVTDIETDGPWPGPNSMRSFASVAPTAEGIELSRFEAVLGPLPGAAPNPDTYTWFQTVPEAWTAATKDPRPVLDVVTDHVTWLQQLPEPRMFTASPITFDGAWIDYYLRRFTRFGLTRGPYEPDVLFHGPGLCLRSYAAAITRRPSQRRHTIGPSGIMVWKRAAHPSRDRRRARLYPSARGTAPTIQRNGSV